MGTEDQLAGELARTRAGRARALALAPLATLAGRHRSVVRCTLSQLLRP